jgi:hypothetical protein
VEITILFTTCGIHLQSTEIGTMIYQEAIFGQRLRLYQVINQLKLEYTGGIS